MKNEVIGNVAKFTAIGLVGLFGLAIGVSRYHGNKSPSRVGGANVRPIQQPILQNQSCGCPVGILVQRGSAEARLNVIEVQLDRLRDRMMKVDGVED